MANVRHRSDEMPMPYEAAIVADAMSRGVISVPPETPLRVVARMMATFHVHAIFVFEHVQTGDDAPRLWALVSDLDLVAAACGDIDRQTAGATAVTPLVTVSANQGMADAAGLMAQHGFAHLAVTDPATHRPIGVISTLDIAQAVAAGHDPGETFPSA
jgi:CBS domain-containing protein